MLTAEYIAGLFDGEGYISFTLRKDFGYLKCEVGISISNETVINLLHEQFPEGKHYTKPGTNRVLHHFYLSGNNAKRFINVIRPHVVIKQDVVDWYDEWCSLPLAPPRGMTDEVMQVRIDFLARYKEARNTYHNR